MVLKILLEMKHLLIMSNIGDEMPKFASVVNGDVFFKQFVFRSG